MDTHTRTHTAPSYESSLYGFKKLRAEDRFTASLFSPNQQSDSQTFES